MNNSEDYLAVSFLPWAGLKDEIKIGSVIFWPFEMKDEKIKNSEIKEHLAKYFKSYVDHKGKPVDTITIASYGNIDFQPLDKDKRSELRSAVNILIFTTIAPQVKVVLCANNRSIGPPSSEIFQLITQNFRPMDDNIAVQAGSLLSGGWKIGEITFSKPWAMGGAFGTPDKELLNGFNKVFDTFPSNSNVREKIFRSLEWFRLSHVESDEVSIVSKVIMMATAFEIFLQFPQQGKRKYFVEYMENNIASEKFKKDYRKSKGERSFQLSLAGCWAWDFYELRSRIVHGDSILKDDLIYKDWITHLIVADLVFLEAVKRKLYRYGCIGKNVKTYLEEFDKLCPNEPPGNAEELLTRWFLGFDDVHKALGWIGETEV